jgi:uncharacterized protein (DUF362 family)
MRVLFINPPRTYCSGSEQYVISDVSFQKIGDVTEVGIPFERIMKEIRRKKPDIVKNTIRVANVVTDIDPPKPLTKDIDELPYPDCHLVEMEQYLSTVSLKHTDNFDEKGIKDVVYRALGLIDFELSKNVKSVLIKPNLCYYWDYSTGETTDPRVVSSLIDYIREKGSSKAEIKIIESDASAMRAKNAFKMLGYEALAEEKSVELLNLSADETYEKDVTVGKHKFTLTLAHSILGCDLFINVPKLKVGPYASGQCLHITCALKNLFGCISKPRKVEFHPDLNEVIVGVNKLIKPSLTVVDGIVALGRQPVRLGLIIAGRDNLAVDFVAAKVMGCDPYRIRYLRLAAEEGVGNVEGLRIVGENMEAFCKLFPRRSRIGFKIMWTTQLWLLRLYTRVSGDVVPSVLEETWGSA